ncbi:MAG: hypothetical protein ABJL72_18590 [Roseobacter sp.]
MKANFALSLSFDGILLLHRTQVGWQLVGKADPTSSTLTQDLAAMRRTASALDYAGVNCKIIIPNDQIRYLTIRTPGFSQADRRAAALAALVDATPYGADELIFDIFADGSQTHVAGVAKETIAEAEAFALEHKLQPLYFAAPPQETFFKAEPYFGTAGGISDGLPVATIAAEPNAPHFEHAAKTSPSAAPENAQDAKETAIQNPSFVSRRRVPTFRTDKQQHEDFSGATAGTVPGFGEHPKASFDEAPKKRPAKRQTSSPQPAPAPVARKVRNEAERFTAFGAKPPESKPRRMGYTGLVVLLSVGLLGGIAAFAGGALTTSVADLYGKLTYKEPTAQFTAPIEPQPIAPPTNAPEIPEVELAALQQDLTDEDSAVLDALRAPVTAAPEVPAPRTQDELRAEYAVSGIWPIAPDVPSPSPLIDLEDLYVTSIDPINQKFDAVALPEPNSTVQDRSYVAPASPAPAGTTFDLDARGLVVATASGAMNPDGILVFAGPPPARPPFDLVKTPAPSVDLARTARLAGFRPRLRPADLIETTERATFSGLTRSELSQIRPRMRPQPEPESALASASLANLGNSNAQSLLQSSETSEQEGATARAVVSSLRPDARPANLGKPASKPKNLGSTTFASTGAVVTPRAVTPKIPSSASASREATVKNALNLRQVNLIGVYGQPSDRRALVRMGNGNYRKVQVGDRLDGGEVSAIGDAELRYQKRGRAVVLKMPRG